MTPWELATYHSWATQDVSKKWYDVLFRNPITAFHMDEFKTLDAQLKIMYKDGKRIIGYLFIHSYYRPKWMATWN